MRAVVCVRPVPVISRVVFSMGQVDGTEAARELAAAEANAVALARALGAEAVVVSWSGPEGEAALRQALAAGATAAVRLDHPGPLSAEPWLDPDPQVTARVLANYLQGCPAELVFCGASSPDQGRGAVGPMLAELLGLPLATHVCGAAREGEQLVCECLWGLRRVKVRLPLPALLTVSEEAPRPGKPCMLHLSRAMRAPLEVVPVTVPPATVARRGLASTERRRPLGEVLQAGNVEEGCRLLLGRLRERRVL